MLATNSPLLNRLKKNAKALKVFLAQSNISCYRIFDWDMPEYPICIDYYEGKIHVAEYKTRHTLSEYEYQSWFESCKKDILLFFNISTQDLFFKIREKHKGIGQYEKLDTLNHFFEVAENGLKFKVNLTDYLDTGLFLDHRIVRKQVMEEAKGKHVLNLFAYTGSFSVYACAGGAFTTTTVDLSNTYLNWAKDNFKLNDFNLAKHQFIKADAKDWIRQSPTRLYDIVVLDPPTMSRSKMAKTKFDVQLDHVELINNTLNHMKEGAVLYFSNNYREFKLSEDDIRATYIENITLKSIPLDFRNKKIHYAWRIIK